MTDYFIKVQFENNNVKYCFKTNDESIKKDNFVVCDTIRGLEIGKVVSSLIPLSIYKSKFELKNIIRKATEGDLKLFEANKIIALEYAKIFKEEQKKLNLGMKLLSTELILDKSKVIFSYVSDARVDFRDLLKELITKIKCKIELKQIPPRDRTQKIGGIGPCGLVTCCSLFLKEFEGITTTMIKNQMLIGNTSKLSGLCDKLLCCLKFEDEQYSIAKKDFPPIKTQIDIDGITYNVVGYNIFSKIVKLKNNLEGELYLSLDELSRYYKTKDFNKNKRKDKNE